MWKISHILAKNKQKMYKLKLKEKINISLDWDGDEASFKEGFQRALNNGFLTEFILEMEVKEKTLKSNDRDCPDDVEVVISHIEIHDMKVFDGEEEEVFLSEIEKSELETHIKESIQF